MDSFSNTSILSGSTQPFISTPLHTIFENIATTTATNNTALIFEAKEGTRSYTYKELNNLANRLAKTISLTVRENRLSSNDDGDFVVAVSMHPSDHLIITLLAILKAGAAYLPLDPVFPRIRVRHILEDAKPVMVIFDGDGRNFGSTFKLTLRKFLSSANDVLLNPAEDEGPLSEKLQLKHLEDGLAIVLYTSGSTGTPKGVRLTNTTILNRLWWQFRAFPYRESETTGVFKTALTFVDSISEIWGPLLNGRAVLVVPKTSVQNPEELVGILEKFKIERLVLVPSLLRSLLIYLHLQKGKKFLKNLKTWVCSGETLPISLAKEFYGYFPDNQHQLCNFYGSTEVMGDVTCHLVSSFELNHWEKVPIGTPIDNTIVYLLNDDFLLVKIGEVGEVYISGLNLASGYVNSRDSDKFQTNPFSNDPSFAKLFRTGDFAKIKNGTLLYEGRTDSQVKIRGQRADLNEIEQAVGQIPGVVKGVVLCYKPGETDQKILAFITSDGSVHGDQIGEVLKRDLVPYMIPQVVLVEDIPLLVSGKVDRQALLKDYEFSQIGSNDDMDYRGVSKDQMAAAKVLFETVASFPDRVVGTIINIDANFYEIGGNSLNSIFAIAKLRKAGYHIGVGDFISASNLGEVLSRLSSEGNGSAARASGSVCYRTKPLQNKFKEAVINMITTSFYQKSPLDHWFRSELSDVDYKEMVDKLWEPLLEQNLSFIVETFDGRIVGVALNHDARKVPEIELNSKIAVVNECTGNVERGVRDAIAPKEGLALYSAWMGTLSTLSPRENVDVIKFIEDKTLELAKREKFRGVLSTNVNLLTQQLATDIYGYETYIDYQVNQYVANDGTEPFAMAPNSQRILVQWKELNPDN